MIEGIRKVITGRGYPRLLAIYKNPFYTSTTFTTYQSNFVEETGFNFPARANMLIRSQVGNHTTYAKILTVEGTRLYIDGWTNGVPSNGTVFQIVGYAIDFDYAQEITQTFDPHIIVHELIDGSKVTKFLGFKYRCEINFETFFPPDILISLSNWAFFEKSEEVDFVLIPHRDKKEFNYRVYLAEPIQIRPRYAEGYAGTRLVFEGKHLVQIPSLTGYGTYYGYNYGVGL